jgi:hypothetical protein
MKPMTAVVRRAPDPVRTRPRGTRLATLREIYTALVESGRWWLIPMVVILGMAALLLVAVAAVEYVAPFVYTIF